MRKLRINLQLFGLRKGLVCALASVFCVQSAGGGLAQSQLADPFQLNIPESGLSEVGYHGSFSQRVDFKVPKLRGIEPHLGLSYDSGRVNSAGPNSLVGAGWRLTGLSSIQRASHRRAVPRFSTADIWLLDGQELVPCGVYKGAGCQDNTEGTHAAWVENFKRIKQIAENNTWEVTARNGTRYVYKPLGTWASEETIPLSGDAQTQMLTQYRYLLAEKIDTIGQKVTYSYACGNSLDCRVSKISYAIGEINFHWESRPDVVTYAAGHMLGESAARLRTVEVRAAGQMLRTYELNYVRSPATGRSLLTSVTERGRDSQMEGVAVNSGTAWPPYTFQYTGATPAPNRVADGYSLNNTVSNVMAFSRGRFSNGRSLGWIKLTNKSEQRWEGGEWVTDYFCVITKSGSGEIAKFLVQNDKRQGVCGAENFRFTSVKAGRNTLARSVSWAYDYYRCSGSECNSYQKQEVRGSFGRPNYISDFDGDGLEDTIETSNNQVVAVRFSKGATNWGGVRADASFGTADLNGDGMTDMLYTEATGSSSDVVLKLSNGVNGFDSVYRANTPHRSDQYLFYGDLNGDGTADIIRPVSGDQYRIYYVTGNRFVQGPVIQLPGTCVGSTDCSAPFTADVNGDGRADMVAAGVHKKKKARVFINMGDRFEYIPRTSGAGETLNGTFAGFTGDGDFDGLMEFALRTDGEDHGHGAQRWTMVVEKPDLLDLVKSPLGAESRVTYTYHEPKTQVDLPMNLFVVQTLETYDGRAVRAKTNYAFSGARYDWEERQFLGFEKIVATLPKNADESGPPIIETSYEQNLASVGRIKQVLRKDATGKTLQQRSETYSIQGTEKPYRVFNTETDTTTNFDSVARTSKVQRVFDTHGLVRATVQHGDTAKTGDEWRHSRWPYPNYPKYIVDRWAVEAINSGTEYHYTNSRQWRRWHYFDGANNAVTQVPSKGLPTQTSEWTGEGAEDKVAQVVSTYDTSNGNLLSEADGLGNTTTYEYDSAYKMFPEEIRNPLYPSDNRQKKRLTWDKVCGVVLTETDENGSVTTHEYDKLCRKTQTSLPGGGLIKFSYSNWGTPTSSFNRTRTLHPNGAGEIIQDIFFDGFGRTYLEETSG